MANKLVFNGFTDETFEFFMAIRFNNNRMFFQSNHDWYMRAVREPCLALADALADVVEKMDPDLDRRPNKALSRINRDIRYTRDKSPYRDFLWLAFRRSGEERKTTLGVYVDVRDTAVSYGMGVYMENRSLMNAVRAYIEKSPAVFLEAYLPVKDEFTLFVEPNRRIKAPEGMPEALIPWYTAKNFYLEKEITDYDLICSSELVKEIEEGYMRLKPLYEIIRTLQPEAC